MTPLKKYTVDWYDKTGVLRHTPVVSSSIEEAIDYIKRCKKGSFVELGPPLCDCGSPKCNICELIKPTPYRLTQ